MKILDTNEFKSSVFDYEKEQEWRFLGQRPAIIDFYADWCGPCKMQAPILEELSKNYAGKIDIYKVDTEATPELAALFRVRGIPSLLFIPATGKPTMSAGFMPKDALENAIKDVLKVEG